MTGVSIRAPRRADAPSLARIWVDTCAYYAEMDADAFQVPDPDGLVEWFESLLERPPQDDHLNIVAEIGQDVVGSLDAKILEPLETADRQMLRELGEPRLYIQALVVDRAHWRRGVGTALMRAAEDWARQRGATRAALDTYMRSPVSVPFYERRMGYSRRSITLHKRL